MIEVGHGLQQVHAGLMAQFDVAFQLGKQMLLQFAHRALVIEQIGDKKQRQNTETKKCNAQHPLVGLVGVQKHEGVHEKGKTAGKHQDEDDRQKGELKFPPFEVIQFFAIEHRHKSLFFCAAAMQTMSRVTVNQPAS